LFASADENSENNGVTDPARGNMTTKDVFTTRHKCNRLALLSNLTFAIAVFFTFLVNQRYMSITENMSLLTQPPRIVVGFGVCLSKEAQEKTQKEQPGHNHQRKPYDVAAILSTRLWRQQQVEKVVVALVVPRLDDYQGDLRTMSRSIRAAGGVPWVISTHKSKDPHKACIRASQMARSFVHESGFVNEQDIVVTSDSDAFPINATKQLGPLIELLSPSTTFRVWTSDYFVIATKGGTFPLSFIGMRVKDWRDAWKQMGNGLTFQDAINRALDVTVYAVRQVNSVLVILLQASTRLILIFIPRAVGSRPGADNSGHRQSRFLYASCNEWRLEGS
jgi:hypothetical protein